MTCWNFLNKKTKYRKGHVLTIPLKKFWKLFKKDYKEFTIRFAKQCILNREGGIKMPGYTDGFCLGWETDQMGLESDKEAKSDISMTNSEREVLLGNRGYSLMEAFTISDYVVTDEEQEKTEVEAKSPQVQKKMKGEKLSPERKTQSEIKPKKMSGKKKDV